MIKEQISKGLLNDSSLFVFVNFSVISLSFHICLINR